jgi:hypothetical protein
VSDEPAAITREEMNELLRNCRHADDLLQRSLRVLKAISTHRQDASWDCEISQLTQAIKQHLQRT